MSNGNVFHSIDLREDILEYLFGLLQTVPGVATVWRNHEAPLPEYDPQTKASLRPALNLLDGDQRLDGTAANIAARHSVKMRPAIAIMSPEIFIELDMAGNRANTIDKNGQPYNPGQALSYWHWNVRSVIDNDHGLLTLLTPNGQMVWTGFETVYKTGMPIGRFGPMACIRFDLYHPINPTRS